MSTKTKRADRNSRWHDQKLKTKKVDFTKLRRVKGKKFLSCEPLLGYIDITNKGLKNAYSFPTDYYTEPHSGRTIGIEWTEPGDAFIGVDWVIAGGESGHGARPMHPDWVKSLRNQCSTAGVPFLFKQWGEYKEGSTGGTSVKKWAMVYDDGEIAGDVIERGRNAHLMSKVGKKEAGRILDGRTYDAFPKTMEVPND